MESILRWLQKRRRAEAAFSWLLAGLAMSGGLIVLFLTFWFAYAIAWFGMLGISASAELLFSRHMVLSHTWLAALSAGFIVLLFLEHIRVPDDYWAGYERLDYRSAPGLPAGVIGALIWLVAYRSASSRMIGDLLLTGPRLITSAHRSIQRALQLQSLNIEAAAPVLSFLALRDRSVSQHQFSRVFPHLDRPSIWAQLGLLEGVIFLGGSASRITLIEPLRQELRAVLKNAVSGERAQNSPQPEPEPEAVPISSPESLSYHDLLGVPVGASPEEIKAAYRARIKECHPDRFDSRDSLAQYRAEEWTKALNIAYQALLLNQPPEGNPV